MCKFITSNNTSIDYSLALSGSHGHQSMKSDISISKFQKLRPRVKMAGWFKSYANVELLCPIMLRERFRKMSCLKIQRKYYNREMSCLNCQQNLLAPNNTSIDYLFTTRTLSFINSLSHSGINSLRYPLILPYPM